MLVGRCQESMLCRVFPVTKRWQGEPSTTYLYTTCASGRDHANLKEGGDDKRATPEPLEREKKIEVQRPKGKRAVPGQYPQGLYPLQRPPTGMTRG
jgi:hypothetical protein